MDVILIRAVGTVDFMTATWVRVLHNFLARVYNRVVNEIERELAGSLMIFQVSLQELCLKSMRNEEKFP